jgi:type I restriction enzyme S subunit
LPNHWQIARLESCFTLVSEAPAEEDGIVTVFRDGEVTLRENRRSDGFTEAVDFSGYRRIRPGYLAIHNMDAFAGAIGVSDSVGKCSPVVTILKPKLHVDARYMAHVLREMARAGWIQANAKSVRERTSEFRWPLARIQQVPLPPLEEQRAIADYLDDQLSKLDRLAEEQDNLISKLSERLLSLIYFRVTSGYEAKVQSTNWLQVTPDGWSTPALRDVATTFAGGTPTSDNEAFWLDGDNVDGLPWLSISDFNEEGEIHSTRLSLSKDGVAAKHLPIGEPGTIVFAMYASVGATSKLAVKASWSQAILGINPKPGYSREYLYWVLRALRYELPKYFRSNTQDNINANQVRSLRVPQPPLEEQIVIAKKLENEVNDIVKLRSAAESLRNTLLERKTAIVSNAVTGRLLNTGASNG